MLLRKAFTDILNCCDIHFTYILITSNLIIINFRVSFHSSIHSLLYRLHPSTKNKCSMTFNISFKLVSAIFFFFSPHDSPSKTKKMLISLKKLLSRHSNFRDFFFSTFSRFKKTNRRGIIYDVMNCLA